MPFELGKLPPRRLDSLRELGQDVLTIIALGEIGIVFELVESEQSPREFAIVAIEEQVAIVWCGANGFLDPLPVAELARCEKQMLAHLREQFPELLAAIRDSGDLADDTVSTLREVMGNFVKDFQKTVRSAD